MGEGYEDLAQNGPSRSWMGVVYRLASASMKKHPPPISIKRARDLRKDPTDAEQRMKRLLKDHFPQARFRFQVPLRHYIADFASHQLRIVVEIDGGQHTDEVDAKRTADIEDEGYTVIRFWNNEVLQNSDGCMIRLKQFCVEKSPPSNSS